MTGLIVVCKWRGKAMAKFEVIVMCGIPGSGKTTFCRERLFPDYIYISLD